MSKTRLAVVFLACSVAAEGAADIAAKEYQGHPSLWRWVVASVFYTAVWISWLAAMRAGVQLGRGAILFWVSGSLIAIFIGVVMYGEALTARQWCGVAAGLVSVVLVAS